MRRRLLDSAIKSTPRRRACRILFGGVAGGPFKQRRQLGHEAFEHGFDGDDVELHPIRSACSLASSTLIWAV